MHTPATGIVHHRLRIRNVGLRAAVDCIGSITIEDIKRSDVAESDGVETNLDSSSFDEEPRPILEEGLHWSRIDNPYRMTINKKSRARLDLYWVRTSGGDSPIVFICSEQPRHEQDRDHARVALKGNKQYKGHILITGSNANPRTIFFTLNPSGKDVELEITDVSPELWPRGIRYFIPRQ